MFEQAFKRIDHILRKDAGVSSELDYIEQTSWVLFLKYLDALEQDRAQIAILRGKPHGFLLEEGFRIRQGLLEKRHCFHRSNSASRLN
jgi:type I restriction enzyme M protein